MVKGKLPSRDPLAPKKYVTAWGLFMNAKRDQLKAANPSISHGQLSKLVSSAFAALSEEEKQTWTTKANEDKERYVRELVSYLPPEGYDARGNVINVSPSSKQQQGVAQDEQQQQQDDKAGGGSSSSNAGTGGTNPSVTPVKKPDRDPKVPKRNLSAFFLYQNYMRARFREQEPKVSASSLSKHTSESYKKLPRQEKEYWVSQAAKDKMRYEAEMAKYTPPPGHDERGFLKEDLSGVGGSGGGPRLARKKRKKDPGAPKRASGAYVFFGNDLRPQLSKENPGIKFTEMGKLLGERWRALDAPTRKKYETMAAQDKIRFEREMHAYAVGQASTTSDATRAAATPGTIDISRATVPNTTPKPLVPTAPTAETTGKDIRQGSQSPVVAAQQSNEIIIILDDDKQSRENDAPTPATTTERTTTATREGPENEAKEG